MKPPNLYSFTVKKNSHEATGGCVEEKYSPAA